MCLYVTSIVQCIVKIFWWLMTGELCWWWAGELWVESERRGAGVLTLTTGPSTDHYHVGTHRSFSSHSYPGHRRWYTAWGVSWSPVPRMTQHEPQHTHTNNTQIWTISVSPSFNFEHIYKTNIFYLLHFVKKSIKSYQGSGSDSWTTKSDWKIVMPYATRKSWNQRQFVTMKKCCEQWPIWKSLNFWIYLQSTS